MSLIANHNSQADSLVVTRQFDDIDAFAEAIKPLDITVNQLTPGCFLGSVNFANFGSLKFTHVNQNQGIRAIGLKSPSDLTFAIALQADQTPVVSHGCQIKAQHIVGFDPTRETDFITGKDSHIVLASVNEQVFHSLAEQMGCDLGQKFLQQNSVRLHSASLRLLKAYYQQITHIFSSQPSLFMQSQMPSLIVEDFVPLLIDTLGKIAPKKRYQPKPFRRYALVKKAEEIAKLYRDKPLTLQKLCDELQTSSSALCYGFKEIFGMSPMAYIKMQRLNGVRRALKNADPGKTSVMQLADDWGFWSPGHFGRDYKKMFGELPSETLRISRCR
ncbi:AraC family transcriptional regulator [Microseira wollei]|uniref:Transcriptional regulator, AraC family protein n=1 Tax=Microseira wollei NIES-4236 TaxID=2530354 RepID=A0AAV3X687_9CYAN|nr:AraC family transcriptional regulator [Microseira wollei]GET35722.1 transcriptional regulator, AraC family protein [Microseira wollei NIES-4236]